MGIPVIEGYTKNWDLSSENFKVELTKPGGVESGDLLLLIVMNDASSEGNAFVDYKNVGDTPWIYTQDIGDGTRDSHTAIYYRIATGEESATEKVSSNYEEHIGGWYVRISDVDTTTPIDVIGEGELTTTGEIDIPAVSTHVDNCLALFTCAFDGGDGFPFTTSNSGWTKEASGNTGTSSIHCTGLWGTKELTGCGSTGIVTLNTDEGDGLSAFQIAIRGTTEAWVTQVGTPMISANTGTTTFNIKIPESVQNGDVLIAGTSVHDDLGVEVTSTDSKFTLINEDGTTSGDDRQLSVWYRTITDIGSEGSSYSWTTSTSEIWSGFISTLRGVDTSNVEDGNSIDNRADNAPNPNCKSMITTNDYSYFIACASLTQDAVTSFTTPSGMTLIATTGSVDANLMVAGMNKRYAGSTRDRIWYTDGAGGGDNVTIQFAVNGLEVTTTSFNTMIGDTTAWSWNTGTYGETIAMKAASETPTEWIWGTIEDSDSWFYKIGSATSWKWISGSTDLFD